MIDRKALEEVLKKHVDEMKESVMVELHLFNGEVLLLRSSIEHHDSYFIGSVFPNKALDPNKIDQEIPRDHEGQLVFDRLIISYQAISYIRITAGRPQTATSMGFINER